MRRTLPGADKAVTAEGRADIEMRDRGGNDGSVSVEGDDASGGINDSDDR